MKRLNTIRFAVACAATLAVAGFAQAAPVDPELVKDAIDEQGIPGDIQVTIDEEGVARLTGQVPEAADGQRAMKAASDVVGVTDVVDLMRTED